MGHLSGLPGRKLAFLSCFAALLALGTLGAQEPGASVLHIHPEIGVDEIGRGQTRDNALRTVTFALALAADEGLISLEVRLTPGVYRSAAADLPGETFPLLLPAGLHRLVLKGDLPGARLETSDPATPLLEFLMVPPERTIEVELRSLELAGGLAGACFLVGGGVRARVLADGVTVSGQEGKAIELFLESGGEAEFAILNSRLEGARGGAAFETSAASSLWLTIEGSTFESLRAYGPSGILGAAVDAHLDPSGAVIARVSRNVFHGVPSALQLTASEEEVGAGPTGGTLDVVFANNVVRGVPGAVVQNAIYLSLWPHHILRIDIAHNTFLDVQHVLFEDNYGRVETLGSGIPWTFRNNIVRALGPHSEFANEGPGFPRAGIAIRRNLLDRSSLARNGADGNFAADPLFAGEAAGDLRLTADSPARDRGEDAPPAGLIDLAGRCRKAASDCPPAGGAYLPDLGAHEFPGYCSEDVAVFERGNCNGSGAIDITDAVFALRVLFHGRGAFACADACDSDDNGKINISDPIYSLHHLFLGGRPPPPPGRLAPGSDPTRDCLAPCE